MDGRKLPQAFITDPKTGELTLDTRTVPDIQFLDYIKRSLDDEIEANTNEFGKVNGKGRRFVDKKQELIDLMEGATKYRTVDPKTGEVVEGSHYQDARKAYAGPTSLMRAMEKGQDVFNERWKVTERDIAKMGDGEKDAFLNGVVDAMIKRIDDTADGRDLSRTIWGSDTKRDQVRAALSALSKDKNPDLLFSKLTVNMERERAMAATRNRLIGNSATARRQAAMSDWDKTTPIAIELATGGTGLGLAEVARQKLARTAAEKVNEQAGRMLLESDPDELVRILTRLQSQRDGMRRVSNQWGRGYGAVGNVAAQEAGQHLPGLLNLREE